MARTSVKVTYSLDKATVRVLDQLSRRWSVSKSEALRRAVVAAAHLSPDVNEARVAALERAQSLFQLDEAAADAWVREIRAERDAWRLPGER